MVDIEFVEGFPATLPLETLKHTKGLEDMMVIRKGSRLSVQPVSKTEYDIVAGSDERRRPSRSSPPRARRQAAFCGASAGRAEVTSAGGESVVAKPSLPILGGCHAS